MDSVLAQTVGPDEVIVINDGSTDRTAEVARSYGDQIIYIEQENQGQGAARNAGLRIAMGEYIAFLDADDYWLPDFLRETTSFLSERDEAVAVSTAFITNRRGEQQIGPCGLQALSGESDRGYILDSFFDTWAKCVISARLHETI
jgi:glycosyltransferase involved in cell wall biosynthesis